MGIPPDHESRDCFVAKALRNDILGRPMSLRARLAERGNLPPIVAALVKRGSSDRAERVGKSPAELLTGQTHPHWLELLGYTRFRRN